MEQNLSEEVLSDVKREAVFRLSELTSIHKVRTGPKVECQALNLVGMKDGNSTDYWAHKWLNPQPEEEEDPQLPALRKQALFEAKKIVQKDRAWAAQKDKEQTTQATIAQEVVKGLKDVDIPRKFFVYRGHAGNMHGRTKKV